MFYEYEKYNDEHKYKELIDEVDMLIRQNIMSENESVKEFDKYIKKSKAKYLLKYDRVKFISPFLRREEVFSIDSLEKDLNSLG